MDTEIKTLTQEFEQMESTFLPSGNLVEEQKGLIKQSEERVKETEKKIDEIKTLTQEFEQILSLKLDTKLEEAGYTKTVEEWIEHLKTNVNDEEISNRFIFDYELIKNAEAFALGPVFSYEGKVKACFSAKYNSLVDLKESLKGKKYVLYVAFCVINSEPIDQIETRDFYITPKDNFIAFDRIGKNPKIRYIFRGHILE